MSSYRDIRKKKKKLQNAVPNKKELEELWTSRNEIEALMKNESIEWKNYNDSQVLHYKKC